MRGVKEPTANPPLVPFAIDSLTYILVLSGVTLKNSFPELFELLLLRFQPKEDYSQGVSDNFLSFDWHGVLAFYSIMLEEFRNFYRVN